MVWSLWSIQVMETWVWVLGQSHQYALKSPLKESKREMKKEEDKETTDIQSM